MEPILRAAMLIGSILVLWSLRRVGRVRSLPVAVRVLIFIGGLTLGAMSGIFGHAHQMLH